MDLTSLGTDYASEIAQNALTSAKNSSLAKKDLSNANDEELMDACKQFEEYFVEQIFKTAWKSTTALTEKEENKSAGKFSGPCEASGCERPENMRI